MKGLVLSGGKGTRLRPITHTSAKQLVPVANKPILFYVLENLAEAGIREVGVVVGDTAAEIKAACGDGSAWGLQLTYLPQAAPLGLAHAVKIAEEFIAGEPFVMYLGDNLLPSGITALVQEFAERKPDAMILLTAVPDPQRFGVAMLSADGRIETLEEKPPQPRTDLALVGVYLFTAHIFEAVRSQTIQPDPSGPNELLLYAIAAAVIGGTLLSGGSGTVAGALIGALFLGILKDGLILQGVNANYLLFYSGLAIVIAMTANVFVARARRGNGGSG